MAEGKKAFVLYCDLIHTVRKMPKDKAGELLMTILAYVNDENPAPADLVVDLVFEPIKQQLKRDLKKWEQFIERQRENGKRGGRPLKPTERVGFSGKPKKADTVTVTVTDIHSTYIKPDENFKLDLPELKINSAIEYLSITKNLKTDRTIILSLWDFFKQKNFTGENSYNSVAKIYSHFLETLKFEKSNGTHQRTHAKGNSKTAGAHDLHSYLYELLKNDGGAGQGNN